MATSASGSAGSDRLAASAEPRLAHQGVAHRQTSDDDGESDAATSENIPNQDAIIAAAWSVVVSGTSEKATGTMDERCPIGSRKGTGSSDRSFASGSRDP